MSWILPIWPRPSVNDRVHRYGFDPGRVRIAYPFWDDVTIGNGVVATSIRLGLGGPADDVDWRVRDAYLRIMPDHLLKVWTLPPGYTDDATRWRLTKLFPVRCPPKQERLA